ncbi:MAG: radical SAM protein [Candidatus Nanoarchaeia archaeon]|jgi:MoaA/NifB/PqqE/SkfB family radical SAM enzyme
MKYSNIGYNPKENLYIVDDILKTRGPLNVGFQITRKCNLKCIYCSEASNLPDLSYEQIKKGLINLRDAKVLKVNITGGEALCRKDFVDIVDLSKDLGFHVAIDSNATLVSDEIADSLSGKLIYFESTIDGTPKTHNRVRGRYDDVIKGIKKIAERKIPLYLAMVLLGKSLDDAKHVLKMGHELGAKYVKYLTPIPKARGKELPDEYLNNIFLEDIWQNVCEFKEKEGLSPLISLADWSKIGKGSVILVNSNGEMVGSPSIGEPGCVTPLGNILKESVENLWKNYPYKINHVNKYTGKTMRILQH